MVPARSERPCTHGRKHGCVRVMHRPCTRHVHGRVHCPYKARGRPCARSVHCSRTAVHTGRKHGRVQDPYTVHRPCTRPCSCYVRPCTRTVNTYRVDGRVHGVYRVRPFTASVHGRSRRLRTVYTAAHDRNTAVYTAHVTVYGP